MTIWDGINEFICVVETESFTAAAKRLDVSVAHISRHVNQLEDRLGAKLLYRTTRKLRLTEVGEVYYQHARKVLNELQEADRAVMEMEGKPTGKLRITAPVYYGEYFLAPLVNDFLLQYPQLDLELKLTNETIDLVEEGYDLAIRLGTLDSSSLMCRKLARRTQYLCASPAYLAAKGTPHTLTDLANHRCLGGSIDHWRFLENGKLRNWRIGSAWSCNSGLALKDAALKGLGIVQLPDYYVQEELKQGLLVSLLEEYRLPDDGIWVVYPHNRHLSPKVKLLVDFLVKKLGARA
ncbi:transcriptional regulator, LysR family [Tolumonas auensis DSM 9187]|uniref:Transcriptional regulator, LysR family n=1 Tax=Tolumonas auensis (strain DSM 9187 / NBRC 110442 / TA 4) TaxID=595494 RepID=C4LCG4_TOLAT|nr:LysR family transcriptional regulator [Tolumonas auensis]ACQ94468.1 transcriptional regulator, LysR family [Tolumonas auensis DSM 9187]